MEQLSRPSSPDPLVLEMRRLAAIVAELAESYQHLQRQLLSRDDRRVGSVLLPLLAEVFDDDAFTAAELQQRALNDRTDGGQALRELIGEHTTDVSGLRAFGRLLGRLEGATFDGCRLVAAGEQRGVLRWRVQVSGA